MEQSAVTAIFLPLALGIIMLGMGMTLTLNDFKKVALYPKAAVIGLVSQLILLPLIGFGLAALFFTIPELAVGLILIALCPGGATSNLISHLAKADLALSISLTAISSIITNFSIPILLNIALAHYMTGEKAITLPFFKTFIQIFLVTIFPVVIGMIIKKKRPQFAIKSEKAMNFISTFFFILILLAAILKERENIIPYFEQAGVAAIILNISALLMGFILGKLFGLNKRQRSSIAIETGIQNGTLAIALALSPAILNNTQMAVPAAIYSLLMFVTAAVVILISKKQNTQEALNELSLS
jgi:BASS family bile acid:Na+ symporter